MKTLKRIVLSLLLLHLTACSGMQPVSIHDLRDPQVDPPLRVGDRVEVITRDSEKLEFAITEIDHDGLRGSFGFVPYDDMRRLRVRRTGGSAEDYEWVWIMVGVAALIALVASADSVTACSPGPCPSN
ncbi:MAG: hypothetical protein RQ826_07550 [Xanthomonadales bacterium]|nr:hypothetical protein [Xanthomonadales bacterium]